VVRDGRIVARGRTGQGGRPHGEALALAKAGESARGGTIYVSLEPCSHHGRTPPCTDAIVAAGIRRAVVTTEDPDPRVAGKGLERLRAAGIEVVTGVAADEARRLQAGHFSRISRGRPYVVLKLAVSADGAIGRMGERQVPVTGEIARRHAQALRSRFDAIMVGRGTIEADDPQLTCRLSGLEHRSPVRVVLDTRRSLEPALRVFAPPAETWVFSTSGREERRGNIRALTAAAGPGGVDLAACLRRLGGEGITRLLVEGGSRLARSLLEDDLVDEVILFRSPQVLGGNIVPALAGRDLSSIEDADGFGRIERRHFGPDRMFRYLRVR
jgi:diaminohydroxyphosphoribosylaminopyrimidine deaminase/5-amino-6-(5-phosphoribosylamino)uracil reductase